MVTAVMQLLVAALLSQEIQLTAVWETRGPSSDPFSDIAGMAETSGGLVIVTDAMNGLVYGYDASSGSARTISRSGAGPNEVRTPTLAAALPDGGVAVFDIGHGRIVEYDARGIFRQFVPLTAGTITNPKGMGVTPDGEYVISGGRFRSTHTVFKFSPSTRAVTASAVKMPRSRDPAAALQTAGGPLSVLPDGSVLFARSAPHGIFRLSRDLGTITTIAADETVVPAIADSFNKQVVLNGQTVIQHDWYYDQARMVALLEAGRILHVITRRNRGDSIWELWRADGTLESRTRVAKPYRPFSMTKSGDVLAMYESPATGEHIAVALRVRTSDDSGK